MKLRTRTISLTAGGKFISIINIEDARELGVKPLDRVVLTKGRKKITTVVNVTREFVKQGQIAIYDEVKKFMNLRSGDFVHVEPREELISKKYIRKKIDGGELDYKELKEIVDDVLKRNLNDLELASFITAIHIHGFTLNESIAMSKAMIQTSKKIKFPGIVVDKHSIGGVPGDKTSMLLVPIIAASGLTIPKTSSRSITSPAGTADRMEILAPVDLNINEIKRVVKKCGGCLVWGGAVDLAPADDLFIQIEHPLSLDPLLLPSVMSKKKAVGSKYVVIDIPVGSEAKIKSMSMAEKLAKDFIMLGKELDMIVDCGITHGDQPIGYAMGPALEAREALETIMNRKYTSDLIDKVTSLAGLLFNMTKKGDKETALKILKSGKAEKKLRDIIAAQGGDENIQPEDIPYAKYRYTMRAKNDGIVASISNATLANICFVAGTPKDKYAGILLHKKIEDRVKKNDPLLTIFAEKRQKLRTAIKIAKKSDIFSFFDHKKKRMLIERI
ncbi:MAG: AMP phosphorylase [Candidatus Aenigmatarchaeota archaeon]